MREASTHLDLGRHLRFVCCFALGMAVNTQGQNRPQASLDAAGSISWVSAFSNGLVTVESSFSATGGPWLPVVNVFTTNTAGGVELALSDSGSFYRLNAADISANPSDMQLVPAGSFQMGDNYSDRFTQSDELPVHNVYLSTFLMDRFEVTNEKMRQVLQWAYDQGKVQIVQGTVGLFVENSEGTGALLVVLKGPSWHVTGNMQLSFENGSFVVDPGRTNYPCIGVSWYGAGAYGNYLSQMVGLSPCTEMTNWTCDLSQNGYRPPTEAEWEKAGRGALTGEVFPWHSNTGDDVDTTLANYTPVGLGHGIFNTKPVGFFDGTNNAPSPNMANGYGLYDMAGNSREWCLDWYQPDWYSQAGATNANPICLTSGPDKIQRGGSWDWDQSRMRCSARDHQAQNGETYWFNGCRMVRRP